MLTNMTRIRQNIAAAMLIISTMLTAIEIGGGAAVFLGPRWKGRWSGDLVVNDDVILVDGVDDADLHAVVTGLPRRWVQDINMEGIFLVMSVFMVLIFIKNVMYIF